MSVSVQQSKSISNFIKRKSEDDCSDQFAKRSKFETKLTDLNFDCLNAIIELLCMHELISMAQVSVDFLELAMPMIKNKRELISLANVTNPRQNPILVGQWNLLVNHSIVQDIGQSIRNLYLDLNIMCQKATDGILIKCTELKELHLENCTDTLFTDVEKPLHNVEIFTVYGGVLGRKLSELNNWFPNLRSLSLNCIVIDESCIQNLAKNVLSLRDLTTSLRKPLKSGKYSLHNVHGMIKSNPQLTSICVNEWNFGIWKFDFRKSVRKKIDIWFVGCKPSDVRLLKKNLFRLEALKLSILLNNFRRCIIRPIRFHLLKKLVLAIGNNETQLNNSDNIPCTFEFERLQHLDIDCQFYMEQWFFMKTPKTLQTLKFQSLGFNPDTIFWQKIATTWPNLIELTVYTDIMHHLNVRDIVAYVDSSRFLQRLYILKRFRFFESLETLESEMPNKFKVIPSADHISIVRI